MRTASLLFGSAFFGLLVSARVSNSSSAIPRCFRNRTVFPLATQTLLSRRTLPDEVSRVRCASNEPPSFDNFPSSRSSLDEAINRAVSHRRKQEDRDIVSKRRIILLVHARDERYSQAQRTTMNFSRPATPWLELQGLENERQASRRCIDVGSKRSVREQRDRNLHGKSS